MADNKNNLFVYVPSNAISDFKTRHLTGATSSDDYWKKVAFLGGSGEIATHGETFGMSTEFAQKIGLTSDITTSNTLMSYINAIKGSVDTLNANSSTTGSVDQKIHAAMQSLVEGAPTAYDTITEIAQWIQDIQGNQGTAATVAATLAKVGTLENKLGSFTIDGSNSTYNGAYYYIHEWAHAEATALNFTSAAETGKYVSAISLNNGTWTVSRENLPTLSVASGSTSYLTVNNHEIGVTKSTISGSTGFVYNAEPQEGHTSYELGDAETIGNGLVTAKDVYTRLRADETFVASALSTIDARITTVVSGATGDLDSTITISDTNSYVSVTIVEEDGKLKTSGSSVTFDPSGIYSPLDSTITLNATENGTSYGSITIVEDDGKLTTTGSSLTINKTNILAKASNTVSSPTTGTGANEYVVVNVTTQNHDVTGVTVEFDPWEEYSAN